MQNLLVLMSTNSNTMNTLNTFSVFSSYTEEILSRFSNAKIHSVFPNGFNLNFNGELVYISYHQEGMLSARGLAIDKQVFDSIHPYLEVGLLVRYRTDQLVFYTRPYVFTIKFIDRVSKNLKIEPTSFKDLKTMKLENRLENMDLIENSGFSKNEALFDILKDIRKTKEVNNDHIKELIGAGLGLTPSGDDFLQGLIFTEQLFKNTPDLQKRTEKQLEERSTTDVSLSYYEALFAGYGNEPLILLFEAVREKEEPKIKKALSFIQQYGETSGYDLLVGILTYLQIY